MKARLILPAIVFALVTGASAFVVDAALAPKYDRLKQFETVLSEPVLDALGERPIDRVIRRKNGTFLVWAGECFVEVTLNAVPPKEGMVGPTTYEIKEVSRIACK
jgi:hypothetical protein